MPYHLNIDNKNAQSYITILEIFVKMYHHTSSFLIYFLFLKSKILNFAFQNIIDHESYK